MRTVAATPVFLVEAATRRLGNGRPEGARSSDARPSSGAGRSPSVAVNPLTVGLTHGTPSEPNWPQMAGALRPATTARARNVVAFEALGTA